MSRFTFKVMPPATVLNQSDPRGIADNAIIVGRASAVTVVASSDGWQVSGLSGSGSPGSSR
jgi:hypothetical protein